MLRYKNIETITISVDLQNDYSIIAMAITGIKRKLIIA